MTFKEKFLEEFEKNNNCSVLETNCYLDIVDSHLVLKYDFMYEGLNRDEKVALTKPNSSLIKSERLLINTTSKQ